MLNNLFGWGYDDEASKTKPMINGFEHLNIYCDVKPI
jgi:hypothetical protein